MQSYVNGLGLGASLIMAIGAQNAHVLRMGIKRQHVVLTVTACIAIDVVLIALGVAGAGAMIQDSPLLLAAARWGGAAFLLWYGLRSWRSMLTPKSLAAGTAAAAPDARQALASVVALSLLNPHVYLDTVVLLGSVGGSYPDGQRLGFSAGAMTASLLWFTALGFGATRLAGFFGQPMAWKCIEGLTGAVMLALAAGLLFS
ncbi:LysE/ArgO family amino acid transporter [Pseudoduganella violaceinigra]|uniref:LysE/ArgO family amino acid transporter n=1 Tax=Pseudoduganella violaceinigra TaxID=246602 RepID=UPI000417E412|nr:LysE/ArgO family amino acid transporter [Pseudoduganella violaceinigra]